MSIIEENYFTDDWLSELDDQYTYSTRHIIERSIVAFELLAQVRTRTDDFIFKGGTSLLLILPRSNRLSIDIDLIGSVSESMVEDISNSSLFNRYVEIERSERNIPLRQFKIYYDSRVSNQEMPVKLDVLEDESGYESISKQNLSTDLSPRLFELDEDIKVRVPEIEDILADKLTAFAPNTIGISYRDREGESLSMDIMKQIFDIGQLFNEVNKLNNFRSVYRKIASREASYQDEEITTEEALLDTIKTARDISLLNFDELDHPDEMLDLKQSRDRISEYLISDNFTLDDATISTAKAAYLAASTLTESGELNAKSRFTNETTVEIEQVDFPEEYTELERLWFINKEAYYYWSHAIRFLKESSLLE